MKRMNRAGLPMLVGVVMFCAQANAAGGKTVSILPLAAPVSVSPLNVPGGAAQPAAAESDTVKVQGRGVGVDKTAALKDAYRDAIERAVGLYVDAETVAKNDEIVTDQILTQSNAYITNFSELGTKQIDGGLVQVRILATVKKLALTTKLTGVMPAQTVRVDNTGLQNVHAQLVTKEKRAEDAAALLKNALDDLNPMQSLLVAGIRPDTQKLLTGDQVQINYKPLPADKVLLRYLFEVKLDREKYFSEFMPHLKKVLDQISVTKPKEIRLTELICTGGGRDQCLKNYLTGKYDENCDGNDIEEAAYNLFCRGSGFYAYFDPVHVYSILWKGKNWACPLRRVSYRPKSVGKFDYNEICLNFEGFPEHSEMGKIYFSLITSLNATCSNGKVTMYELDKSVRDVLDEWHKRLIGKYAGGIKSTDYNIILLDKNGEEIGVYPWQVRNDCLTNVKFAELREQKAGMVYATPFVGCFGESMIQWRDFILEKDQLTKVASIKIEVAE